MYAALQEPWSLTPHEAIRPPEKSLCVAPERLPWSIVASLPWDIHENILSSFFFFCGGAVLNWSPTERRQETGARCPDRLCLCSTGDTKLAFVTSREGYIAACSGFRRIATRLIAKNREIYPTELPWHNVQDLKKKENKTQCHITLSL